MDFTSSLRVLVVDDCRDAAESLGQLLRLWGYEPLVALGGQTALELAGIYEPHVALLDLAMPHMDGVELTRRLRARPELAGLAIIAVTGITDPVTCHRALINGIEMILHKPVDPRSLETLLADIAAQTLVKTTPPAKKTKKLPIIKDVEAARKVAEAIRKDAHPLP